MNLDIETDCLLSIVTIHKGNETNLEFTLNSLTHLGLLSQFSELILVNANPNHYGFNGENFARFEQFINVDSGIFNAMNFGLTQCKGKYVVFVNSGDAVSSKVNEYLIKTQLESDSKWFVAKSTRRDYLNGWKEDWFLPTSYLKFYFAVNSYCHQSTFVRRKVLCEMGGFREDNSVADWEVSLILHRIQKPSVVDTYWANFAGLGVSDFPNMKLWCRDVSNSRIRNGIHVVGCSPLDFGLQKLISIALRFKNYKKNKLRLKAVGSC